jgi:hypothetical protein
MRNFFAKLQLPNTPGLPPILRMFPDFLVPLKVREFSEPGSKVNRAFLCKFFLPGDPNVFAFLSG